MAFDYAGALAADLDSNSDSETPIAEVADQVTQQPGEQPSLQQLSQAPREVKVAQRLLQIDPRKPLLVAELSLVTGSMDMIRREIARYADKYNVEYMDLVASVSGTTRSEEYQFLIDLSALPDVISAEISLLHHHVAARYKAVFPEFESLVSNAVDYCRIVERIGVDLQAIRSHESFLKEMISGEKVLAVFMAALQQAPLSLKLLPSEWASVAEACAACVRLGTFSTEVSEFVAQKLAKYAPNLSALVGPVVASQLLVSTGSLAQLALTPSCNLPSLGVRDLLSQRRKATTHVLSTGYLYHCELISALPPEIVKQALRIVSGKVILAARIDVSRSSSDGSFGARYRRDVQERLDKLLLPPEASAPKAIPVPQERKSKKRAGRRLRKMKERFNMSELRKAQNKMEFGKAERTVTDSFGEEVGLGMSRELDVAKVNRNTDARLSKAMVMRLHKQREEVQDKRGLEDFSSLQKRT
ncbi:Nop domain-containing protein [Metschnikowia bicuspidata]|uniref:Nop domain-containing protein n=1 Tax=Metschnikowia bicuspidata TaxID=27322 RepID=A0A4P9ZD39_9ASCO|nr:Nop domain-containing protein [Metschnikowia bicuspidata]